MVARNRGGAEARRLGNLFEAVVRLLQQLLRPDQPLPVEPGRRRRYQACAELLGESFDPI